jgi:hypothetical protein
MNFLEKTMLLKLVIHFVEVISPFSQALCIIDGAFCRLMTHATLSWKDATQICQETLRVLKLHIYIYASSKEGFP